MAKNISLTCKNPVQSFPSPSYQPVVLELLQASDIHVPSHVSADQCLHHHIQHRAELWNGMQTVKQSKLALRKTTPKLFHNDECLDIPFWLPHRSAQLVLSWEPRPVRLGIAYGAHTFHSPGKNKETKMSTPNKRGIKTATTGSVKDKSPSLS